MATTGSPDLSAGFGATFGAATGAGPCGAGALCASAKPGRIASAAAAARARARGEIMAGLNRGRLRWGRIPGTSPSVWVLLGCRMLAPINAQRPSANKRRLPALVPKPQGAGLGARWPPFSLTLPLEPPISAAGVRREVPRILCVFEVRPMFGAIARRLLGTAND